MNPTLRNLLVAVGTVTVGGIGFALLTPQPASRTMAELRAAGIANGQKFVLACPERLTPATTRRIRANQPGLLRPRQRYATVARVAVCFGKTLADGGTGNCLRPDGGVLPGLSDGEGEIVIPSLRRDVVGLSEDAGVDDAGEAIEVDDSWQYSLEGCQAFTCATVDQHFPSPWANSCGALNRLWLVPQPCVLPNCFVGDGGAWVDDAVVDCKSTTPTMGATDGGKTTRYAGCNVMPAEQSSGTACLPSSCSVVAGDRPEFDL
jgi:hypothetical protein